MGGVVKLHSKHFSLYAWILMCLTAAVGITMFVFLILPSLSTFSTFVVDYCKAIEQNEDTRSIQFSYLIPVAADRLQDLARLRFTWVEDDGDNLAKFLATYRVGITYPCFVDREAGVIKLTLPPSGINAFLALLTALATLVFFLPSVFFILGVSAPEGACARIIRARFTVVDPPVALTEHAAETAEYDMALLPTTPVPPATGANNVTRRGSEGDLNPC